MCQGPGLNEIGKAAAHGTTFKGGNRRYTRQIGKSLHCRLLCVLGRNQIVCWERKKGRGALAYLGGGQGRRLCGHAITAERED